MKSRNIAQLKRSQIDRAFEPTRPNPTTAFAVVGASRDMDAGLTRDIAIKLHDAFAQLCSGSTDDALFDRLAAAINVGMIRAEQIDPLLEASLVAGRDALMDCDRINGRHGHYGFTGPGMAAMKTALDDYETMVAASTPHQMQAALDESMRRMRSGEVIRA